MSSNISVLALAMAVKEQATIISQDGVGLVEIAERNVKAIKESSLDIDAISSDVMVALIETLAKSQVK